MKREEKESILELLCRRTKNCDDCLMQHICGEKSEIRNWEEEAIDDALACYHFPMDKMTPDQYVEKAMRTNDGMCSSRLFEKVYWQNAYGENIGELINGALGLTGEAGEVADLIKKYIFHGHELDEDTLVKEMGDVMWYMALLCHALDIQLSTVMERNIEKLEKRYKDGFSEEASRNRKE